MHWTDECNEAFLTARTSYQTKDSWELKVGFFASEEGFLVDLETPALKKILKQWNFEHIKRKFDESLKNRQVQEKVKLELGKKMFKRYLRIDVRPRKKIRLICLVFIQTH